MGRPSDEAIKKISVKLMGHPVSKETRAKISAALSGRKNGIGWSRGLTKDNDPRIANMSLALKGKPSPKKGHPVSEEQKRKQSLALTGRKQTEEQKQRRRENPVRYWLGKKIPEYAKEKMSKRKYESWQDPEYVKKVMEGRKISPNKSELKLFKLLEKLYPGEWKFTGDFSFTINGKCPDFVNVNGQKKIIELFGDYWHQGHIPKARADVFAPYGYKTLVVWESEMKNMHGVAKKISEFYRKEGGCFR
jgi:G:T-mismatch repair DNA endonuclease (very short patch repair protein)